MQTSTSYTVQRSGERAFLDHGWLKTYHSFSFGEYFDPDNQHWGALRVFNDDVIAGGTGFGTHPHRDMEILTYVLDGELEHRDSMGNIGVVRPGGVQYLSAGSGIRHSEYNHSKTADCRIVQMWVMPQARNLAPRYGQVNFALAHRSVDWLPIASGRKGVESQIAIWQDAACYVTHVDNDKRAIDIDADRFGYLFVADGTFTVRDGHENAANEVAAGDALRIVGGRTLTIEGSGELVLWDVPPLPKP